LNDKSPFKWIFIFFLVGLVLGASGTAFYFRRGAGESRELRERFEQVNRDLGSALAAQREAAERAARLQTELQGITNYARSIEAGTGRIETRAANLTERLDGAIVQSGELFLGIDRASDSLEESRVLLVELGTLIRTLPGDRGAENPKP
jgi:chromosome segregation ATPase